LNIDIAPTLIDLAGVSTGSEETTDGQSFKFLLTSNLATAPVTTWRNEFLVEHVGEFRDVIEGCPALTNQSVAVCVVS